VDYLFAKFRGLVSTPPKWRKGNGKREAYRFSTRSLPALTPYFDKFFVNRKKIIPKDLKLNPISLAIWFMDDGSKSRSSVYLNTQQFTLEEVSSLIGFLDNQLGIKSTINKDKKYFRIRIRVGSIKRFIEIVDKYILPEFRYKLPLVMTP